MVRISEGQLRITKVFLSLTHINKNKLITDKIYFVLLFALKIYIFEKKYLNKKQYRFYNQFAVVFTSFIETMLAFCVGFLLEKIALVLNRIKMLFKRFLDLMGFN